ncbi:MAG: hypothetical protein ABGX84_07825 [Alcanivorax sp.]
MTQWQPIYLRAADEAAMMEALDAAGLVGADPETDEPVVGGDPHVIRLKPLPNLTEKTGGMVDDGEGGEYPERVPIPGYHVNVLVHPDHEAAYRAALADVLIDPEPDTPHVKYAGCA